MHMHVATRNIDLIRTYEWVGGFLCQPFDVSSWQYKRIAKDKERKVKETFLFLFVFNSTF